MTRSFTVTMVALAVVLAACRSRAPAAYGEANSVIIAATDSVWAGVEDTVRAALEPRIFTVRDERAFEVTHIVPTASEWSDLRKFKRVVVVGRVDDPWMADVLEDGVPPDAEPPLVLDRTDVWARGQTVHAVVVPAQAGAASAVEAVLPELGRRIDEQYRAFVRRRMFASGQNTELQHSLSEAAGFSLLLPEVYRQRTTDSTYIFYNAYPDPGELMRSVLVGWRGGEAVPDREAVLDWRDEIAAEHYTTYDQRTQRDRVVARRLDAVDGLEVRGIWSTPEGGWPAAGPFVTRAVPCPEQNRVYLLDAWLYAPGKDKYQYILQLETILDSFTCDASAPAPQAARAAAENADAISFHPGPGPRPGPAAVGRRPGGAPA